MFKIIFIFFSAILLNVKSCDSTKNSFLYHKIQELKDQEVYNPPASVWEWTYRDTVYYYVTADCCDQFSDLYTKDGELICHPDGGFTGRGDGKCPFDLRSNDTLDLKRKLIWKDDRRAD